MRKKLLALIGYFRLKEFIVFIASSFFIVFNCFSQDKYTIPSCEMHIKGSSNLHDWELNATQVFGRCEMNCDGQEIKDLKRVYVVVASEGLKSSTGSGTMERNVYKALKTSLFKNIVFNLDKIITSSANGNENAYSLDGTITIAGVSLHENINVTGVVEPSGLISFTGNKKLKMTDYNVEPPKAMMGLLKTNNEIEITFKIYLKKAI